MDIDFEAETIAFAFVAIAFVIFAAIELAFPVRRARRGKRWAVNVAMFAIGTIGVRLIVPLSMLGSAELAANNGWGVLTTLSWPDWAEVAITIIALDLALYLQHWATHRVPLLWRLHKVHHSDGAFDVSTAARFHPLELMTSLAWKSLVVLALGFPALGVFAFIVLFNVATLFTHANFALPRRAETPVRSLLVTPDMHRIHHSSFGDETDSNYGTLLSGWDRLFGTYTAEAKKGQQRIRIGLAEYQDDRPNGLLWSLFLPFRR